MDHDFVVRFGRDWPPASWSDVSIVVAVSGGPDSVALLRALDSTKIRSTPGRIIVAHFHHGIREEADGDADFVADLARQLKLPCELDAAEQLDRGGEGLEAALRDARYRFLKTTAESHGARFVVTGHTWDDQIETILHNLLRGTGLAGLSGIPRTRRLSAAVTLMRPILELTREDVMSYLREIGQPYRTDESNEDKRFTRNRIRHDLIPLLETIRPHARRNIGRVATIAGEAHRLIQSQAEELLARCRPHFHHDSVGVSVGQLLESPEYLRREALICLWKQQDWPLQDMNHTRWHQLAGLMDDPHATQVVLPGGILASRDHEKLWLHQTNRASDED